MSDVELVIKIPEEIRLALINNIQLSPDQKSISDSYIIHAIVNGTPLDEYMVKAEKENFIQTCEVFRERIDEVWANEWLYKQNEY